MAHYGHLYLNEKKQLYIFTMRPFRLNTNLYDYDNVRRSYGRNVDQGTVVCRELFSGFFDKFSKLKFIHSFYVGWRTFCNQKYDFT